ncbi:MAG TPA: CHAP domain-containing protein [Polyangiaceae bacterium]|jgi:MYXO-CTERM domain-containing protein
MRIVIAVAFVAAGLSSGCSGAGPGSESVASTQAATTAVSGSSIATLATANVGQGACTKNTLGGSAFESSCTGNGGQPEYWCADFAIWVWANVGADVSGLTAAAGSFYVYGQNNGTLSNSPAVGDAVVFDYQGGGVADHVAIVTQVSSNGTIETVSGDWNGDSGTEAQFASTSHVVLNSPAYAATVGSAPAVMGMTISGFVSPVGLTSSSSYAASFVSQSFPFATSALTMTAGQTIPSYIEMKNTGSLAWDSNTHLGTTQPRDRTSVFADATWLAPNRPAGVAGSVAVGSTYKFTFDLHAPSKPGTYFEYFDLVEEGVAWFGDPGQGGPPDDDLEVQIVVVAGPGTAADGGADEDAATDEDAGIAADAGKPGSSHDDAGVRIDAGSPVAEAEDAGTGASWAASGPGGGSGSSGGCTTSPAPTGRGLGWLLALAAIGSGARLRRRRAASKTQTP